MFRHPVTSQPLGHTEQALGTLVVTAVEPGAATGRLVPGGGPGRPGAGPRRWRANHRGAPAGRGSADQRGAGRLRQRRPDPAPAGGALLGDPREDRALPGGRSSAGPGPGGPDAGIERLTPRGGAPARRGGRGQLPAGPRGDDPRPRDHVDLRTDRRDARDRSARRWFRRAYPPRFAWEETPELERRYPLDGPVRALALGDLDGDGRTELVVADEQSLHRLPDGRGGQPGRRGGTDASAAARPDPVGGRRPAHGSGRTQLVVVDQRGEGRLGVRARVLEWSASGGFRVLYDTSGRYLRVVRVGTENWLLEQDAGEDEPFEPGDPPPRLGRGALPGRRRACACRGASASTASP